MWTKIEKNTGKLGRSRRETFAVRRNRGGAGAAVLVLPVGTTSEPKVNIYSDGTGRLAFAFGRVGEFSVHAAGRGSRALRVSIPHEYVGTIPYGTTDVDVGTDGDMIVLDLNQLAPTPK